MSQEEIHIKEPIDITKTNEFYNSFSSLNTELVLDTILSFQSSDINTFTFAYLMVLTGFHSDTKVRRESKKLIKLFANEEFWNTYSTQWKSNHRKTQSYHQNKIYYQHEHIDTTEYFLFAYVNRRNFYSHNPVKGLYNENNILTGDKDKIINVFECYGPNIIELPSKITSETDIGVVKVMNAVNLNIHKTINQLSSLPRLHNLRLWTCGVDKISKSFSQLKNLKRLGLYKNKIESIDTNTYLPNLEFLGIEGSTVNEIDLKCFPSLKFLSVNSDYDITFKNVTKEFSVGYGKVIYETVKPK